MSHLDVLLDRILVDVPTDQLDEAEQFVAEVKFMCRDFISRSPLPLFKEIQSQPDQLFFRRKNRHRSITEAGNLLNSAMHRHKAFERSLDVTSVQPQSNSCIVFIPDGFSVNHSIATVDEILESIELSGDAERIGSLILQNGLETVTSSSKHVVIHNVPFYYCIRR